MLNQPLLLKIVIVLISFLSEFIDSSLGMGYGTTLTPVLLLFGFEPLQVVPAILLSELITGLLAGITHHSIGNVEFLPKSTDLKSIVKSVREKGLVESLKQTLPLHLKVALLIAACSIVGTVAAVMIAVRLPKKYLATYIGVLILCIGIIILVTLKKTYGFSWRKIIGLGLIASFNKGMSGGGYGPVVTGGQLLSGVEGKSAVGITSLAEGLTCFVGVVVYVLTKGVFDVKLFPYVAVGAVLSVPFSAYSVKKIETVKLKAFIGILTTILGMVTLTKIILKG